MAENKQEKEQENVVYREFQAVDNVTGKVNRPRQISLSGKLTDEWQLTRPIPLTLKVDELGQYVVAYRPFETSGVGDTEQEAIDEFASMLIDLYEYLNSLEPSLTLHYLKLLERLRSAISSL